MYGECVVRIVYVLYVFIRMFFFKVISILLIRPLHHSPSSLPSFQPFLLSYPILICSLIVSPPIPLSSYLLSVSLFASSSLSVSLLVRYGEKFYLETRKKMGKALVALPNLDSSIVPEAMVRYYLYITLLIHPSYRRLWYASYIAFLFVF